MPSSRDKISQELQTGLGALAGVTVRQHSTGIFGLTGVVALTITGGSLAGSASVQSGQTLPTTAGWPANTQGWVVVVPNAQPQDDLVLDADGMAVTGRGTNVVIPAPVPPAAGGPSDRQLVVYEAHAGSSSAGRLIAIPPDQATGIPLPTFAVRAGLPTVGTAQGQAAYDTVTRKAQIWDGNAWQDVTASPIKTYVDEAQLYADATQPVGSYGITQSTGSLYVMTPRGWLKTGNQHYPDAATLLADTPTVGTVAIADDEESIWEYGANGWRCLTVRSLPSVRTVYDWDRHSGGDTLGDRALALDKSVMFVRTRSGWVPNSIYEATQAEILADTVWPVNGQQAISTDTGQIYVFVGETWTALAQPPTAYADRAARDAVVPADGDLCYLLTTQRAYIGDGGAWHGIGPVELYADDAARDADDQPHFTLGVVGADLATGTWYQRGGGMWLQDPIQHYPTEADLLAATPPEGTLAWGDDNGLVYTRHGGAWRRVNSPTVTVNANPPAAPAQGDLLWHTNHQGRLKLYDGTEWNTVGPGWKRGTFANRPDWNNVDYGDIYEATDTKQLWYAGEAGWWPLNSAVAATKPPDANYSATILQVPKGTVAKFTGHGYVVGSGAAPLVISFNGPGAQNKLTNSMFGVNMVGGTDMSANGASSVESPALGGGAGNGWYVFTRWRMKPYSSIPFEIVVDRLLEGHSCVSVKSHGIASDGHYVNSHALFTWDNSAHECTGIYFSAISVSGWGTPEYYMQQV